MSTKCTRNVRFLRTGSHRKNTSILCRKIRWQKRETVVLTYKWLSTGGSGRSGFQPENSKVMKGSESFFWVAGRSSGLLLSPLSEVCVEMKRSRNGRVIFALRPASSWTSRLAFEDPAESGRKYPGCWETFILGDAEREWYPSCSRSLFFKCAIRDSQRDSCWGRAMAHQFGPLSFLSYPSNPPQQQESGLLLDRTSIGVRLDAWLKIKLSIVNVPQANLRVSHWCRNADQSLPLPPLQYISTKWVWSREEYILNASRTVRSLCITFLS